MPALLLEEAGINMSNCISPLGYIDLLLVTNTVSGESDSVRILTHIPSNEKVMVCSGSSAKTVATFGKPASG